jgi:hypothetical protein
MKKVVSLIVGLALLLALTSVIGGRMEKPRFSNEQIASSVPMGASPAQVFAILDAKHIEHFGYEVDPDKKRYIVARSRGSRWSLVRKDHSVTFSFDDTDHLISKEPHIWLTGP